MLRRTIMKISEMLKRNTQPLDIVYSGLPKELYKIIDGAFFCPRSYAGEPRVIVMFNGYGPFIYSKQAFDRFLTKHFPSIDEEIRKRATRYLESGLVDFLRNGNFPNHVLPRNKKRSRWVNEW